MIAYLDYTVGIDKGQTKQDDFYNGPFKLGDIHSDYTSQKISEAATVVASTDYTPVWATDGVNLSTGVFKIVNMKAGTAEAAEWKRVVSDNWFNEQSAAVKASLAKKDVMIRTAAGVETFANFTNGKIASADLPAAGTSITVFYEYDNEIIPQAENKIPTLKGVMKNMTLLAHARRIAISKNVA